MRYLALLKVGNSFPVTVARFGDFEDWTARGIGIMRTSVRTVSAHLPGPLPPFGQLAGVVVMGSHAMVSDREEWSERTACWVREVVQRGIPFLGICFGHQLLAHAMGGEVGFHPKGPEVGTRQIQLTPAAAGDPLFSSLPSVFLGHTTHSQTVLRLPLGTTVLARNAHEPHHAIRLGDCAWGVQFHPEFNEAVMRDYVDEQAESLREHGWDPVALHEAVCPTPESAGLLRHFANLAFRN
jgi:GMP synthase (glutamine-hydrolysing)